jgi:galactitol-specific phosphotransferase system IIB component
MSKTKDTIAPVDVTNEAGVASPESSGTTDVVVSSSMEIGHIAGEITKSDIIFPTVKIIQKMSDNPNNLEVGTIALNGDMLVADEKGVATLSFLSVKKYYKEVLPFGAGMPRIFDSKEEALAAGFRVAASRLDRESGDPLVEDAVQALVAFEKPENRTDLSFPFEVCGNRYSAKFTNFVKKQK